MRTGCPSLSVQPTWIPSISHRNAPQSVLDGTVIGRNMQRHRHQEFIRFLNG